MAVSPHEYTITSCERWKVVRMRDWVPPHNVRRGGDAMLWLNIAVIVMQAIQLGIQVAEFILNHGKQK